MQWSAERHGGFTTADAPVRPLPDGPHDPAHVNVADQLGDPDSLLRFVARLIFARRRCPELGWGAVTVLESAAPSLLCHRCDWEDAAVVAAHNLGAAPATARLALGADVVGAEDVLDGERLAIADGELDVALDGYGHRWLRLRRAGDRRLS
jgi:glycosidase